MRIRQASVSVGLGLSLLAGVLTSVVITASPAQAVVTLPTLANAQPIGFNDQVSAAAAADDMLYVGGNFTQAGRTTGAGAFARTDIQTGPGSVHTGAPQFAKGTRDASVFASVLFDNYGGDGSFGWFVGGDFTSVGGYSRANFAAINFNGGGVIEEWSPAFDGPVTAMAIKPATGSRGQILYVGGSFTSVSIDDTTSPRGGLAAFDINTKQLLPWAPALDADPAALVVSGDRVYVGGSFGQVRPSGGSWTPRSRIAAIATDDTGTLLRWAPSVGQWSVNAVAVKDDTVYVGGDFADVTPVGGNATARSNMAAFAADDTGTLLPWAPAFNGSIATLSVYQGPGIAGNRPTLIIGGNYTSVTPVAGLATPRSRLAAVELDTTGTLLPWAPSFNGIVRSTSVSQLWHLCPTGAGRCVYVGGDFTEAASAGGANESRARIAAVSLDNGTGTLLSWSPGVGGPTTNFPAKVWTVSAGAYHGNVDATVFLGGEFSMAGMAPRTRLAALDAQGELTSWAPHVGGGVSGGVGGRVTALAVNGGQVYAGGTFTSAAGNDSQSSSRLCAASFDTSGVMSSWDPLAGGSCVGVNALAAAGSRVYVGGNYYTPGNAAVNLGGFSATGAGTLTTWVPGAGQAISSMDLAADRLYVAGPTLTSFTQNSQTVTRNGVASILLDDTGTVTNWNPNVTQTGGGSTRGVTSVSVAGSKAYLAGTFTTVGGQSRARLAAVSTEDTGTLLPLNVAPNNTVNGAVLAGSQLVVGGNFTTLGGQTRQYAATVDDTGTGVVGAALNADNTIGMVTSADDQVVIGGSVKSLGGAAIGNVAYGPRVPTGVTASADQNGVPLDGELALSWTAPSWSGTFPIQGYRIDVSADNGATWSTLVANTGSTSTNRMVTGLTNGTAYSFRVTPITRLGGQTSEPSTPVAPIAGSGVIRGSQTQLAGPAGIARDSVGRLYIANRYGSDGNVTVYAANAVGNVPPVARLTRPAGGADVPVGLAMTSNGDIWVSYESCFLARFPALAPSASGDVSANRVVNATTAGTGSPCLGLAIDPMSSEILLSRGWPSSSIYTLPADAGGPVGTPASWTDNVSPVRTVSGLDNVFSVSVNDVGDLLVRDDTSVVKIPRLANGVVGSSVTPLQRVTHVGNATQVTERSDGSLVVVNDAGASVPVLDVFAPGATGAATPVQVVTGSAPASTTHLQGLTLSADELTAYVTSRWPANAVTWLALPALAPPNPGPGPGPNPAPVYPASAPRAVAAIAGDASAIVEWQTPSNSGSFPVSSYQVTASPGGATCMTAVLTCTVRGLANGTTYTFRVKALNGAGWSQESEQSNAVTPSVDPAPSVTLVITGSRDGRKITVSGASTGLSSGAQVTPWVRVSTTRSQVRGRPVAVSEDGAFDWSRRVPDVRRVWVHFTADGVKSNVLSLRR